MSYFEKGMTIISSTEAQEIYTVMIGQRRPWITKIIKWLAKYT